MAGSSIGRSPLDQGGIEMKMRIIAPVALAAIAAGIGFAPIASADSTVVETPGNAEVTATPGAAALQAGQLQYPWYGYGYGGGLLFHHGGGR
jgi:hypothetical protein